MMKEPITVLETQPINVVPIAEETNNQLVNLTPTIKETDKEKYKLLFDVAFHEYKSEIERAKSVEDKVNKLFTVLNILMTVFIALLLRQDFWLLLKKLNNFFQFLEFMLMAVIFGYLAMAWYELFKNLKTRKVVKLELETDYEDIVYDDSKDVNYLYWKLYKTYKSAIVENSILSNEYHQSLTDAWKYIKTLFIAFCLFILMVLANFAIYGGKNP